MTKRARARELYEVASEIAAATKCANYEDDNGS